MDEWMRYFFISDDGYFLRGLEETLPGASIGSEAYFVNINNNEPTFTPKPNDIVLLAVFNIAMRRRVIGQLKLAYCKVIVITKANSSNQITRAINPWVISWNSSKNALFSLLKKINETEIRWHQVSLKEADVFFYLGAGFSHEEVARNFNLSIKHVYNIRRNINIYFGFAKCNSATSILLYRDILEMNSNNKFRMKAFELARKNMIHFERDLYMHLQGKYI